MVLTHQIEPGISTQEVRQCITEYMFGWSMLPLMKRSGQEKLHHNEYKRQVSRWARLFPLVTHHLSLTCASVGVIYRLKCTIPPIRRGYLGFAI